MSHPTLKPGDLIRFDPQGFAPIIERTFIIMSEAAAAANNWGPEVDMLDKLAKAQHERETARSVEECRVHIAKQHAYSVDAVAGDGVDPITFTELQALIAAGTCSTVNRWTIKRWKRELASRLRKEPWRAA